MEKPCTTKNGLPEDLGRQRELAPLFFLSFEPPPASAFRWSLRSHRRLYHLPLQGGLRPRRGEEWSAAGGRNGPVDHFERRTPRAQASGRTGSCRERAATRGAQPI